MPVHLVADLRRLILTYLPIKLLQQFEEQAALNLVKTKFLTQNELADVLSKKYNLTNTQIDSFYNKHINNNNLLPMEGFTNIAALNGDVGYEAHIYIKTIFALLYAVKQKDLQLVNYYIGRLPLMMYTNQIIVYEPLLYYAILSNNINIIKAICALFAINLDMLLSVVSLSPVLLSSTKLIEYIINNISNKVILNRLPVLKFYSDNKSINYDKYINYIYLTSKLTLNQILELAQPILLINYFKTIKPKKLIMNQVRPKYFSSYGIYTKYYKPFEQPTFVFDSSQLQRVTTLKQLILDNFTDTADRECYINYLNVLLNMDITFNLITITKQFDNLFIAFVLSVLHSQAINIAIDNQIIMTINPTQISDMSLPNLASLMFSTIVYDSKIYKKILPFKQTIDKFYVIKLNIILSANYCKFKDDLPCRLVTLRQRYSQKQLDELVFGKKISDYETMIHLNDECQRDWARILAIPNIYVGRQFIEDKQLAIYYKENSTLIIEAKRYNQNLTTFDSDTILLKYC